MISAIVVDAVVDLCLADLSVIGFSKLLCCFVEHCE